jgi:hypothetical protein
MKPALELNLTQSVTGLGRARFGAHGEMAAPEGDIDPKRGLRFPLKRGGFMLASGGVISDAAGTLEIVFTPAAARPGGALVQAWGQYSPLIALTGEGVSVNVYDAGFPLLVALEGEKRCLIRFTWHHDCGFTLTVQPQDKPAQVVRRRLAWKAYGQKYVPFSIGGTADKDSPRLRRWAPGVAGWVRSVRLWSEPQEVPGPIQVDVSGEPIRLPFKPTANVKVLELDDPPIQPDPLGLVSLPHRSLDDLRKTREVGGLDQVVRCCKNEIEVFSMLTWYVGSLWPHCNYWPWPPGETRWTFWKRGHELLPLIRAGEAGGMCGGYAHVMEEVFWSFGFDARRINVTHHSSFEAYSSMHDRWVICDASRNAQCHLLADDRGRFLNCGDIIRRYEAAEHNGKALSDVRQMICREENLVPVPVSSPDAIQGTWYVYAYDQMGLCMDKTHQLGRRTAAARPSRMAWYYRDCEREWAKAQALPAGEPEPVLVKNLDDLYPSRNRVNVGLAWLKPGETLRVAAEPVGVTFFDTLIAAFDGGAEMPVKGRFAWKLHPGVNLLTVRTRNRLGAVGYPFKLRLWKRS